jgi:gamma-glutamyltranspeptidase/glutathione hydrolase
MSAEGRLAAETLVALERRGHVVEREEDWSLGRLSAVSREETPAGWLLKAGANPRQMQGYAVGR